MIFHDFGPKKSVFQKFYQISLKNGKTLKKNFFDPKNGQKWPKNQFLSKKIKKITFFKFWSFLPPKIPGMLIFLEKIKKKGTKLVKNQKKTAQNPKIGQKWSKMAKK